MSMRAYVVVVASVAFAVACGSSASVDGGAPENLPFDDSSASSVDESDVAGASGAVDDTVAETTDETVEDLVPPDDVPTDDGFSIELEGLGDTIELGDGVSLETEFEPLEFDFEDLTAQFAGVDTLGDDPTLDTLWSRCEGGDLPSCDQLFILSPIGSGYEVFGDTCGGRRNSAAGSCSAAPGSGEAGVDTFSDHAGLDALWSACVAGAYDACDDLWWMSPIGSGYEAFGASCGDTIAAVNGGCVEHFGSGAGDNLFAESYGDDPGLDAVFDACTAHGAVACDLLFDMSPLDSDYEDHAATCGVRRPLTFVPCT